MLPFRLNGGTINVSGQPFDFVILQLDSAPAGACCPNCLVSAPVPLDNNGSGSHSGLVDGDGYAAEWLGTGLYSGCVGTTTLACSGTSSLSCQATTGNATPYGTLTISGPGSFCKQPPPPVPVGGGPDVGTGSLCNSGEVSVTINASTVSTTYGKGTTAAQVAAGLANAINGNPAFAGVIAAGSSGSMVTVGGPAVAPQNLIYYPWSASCTYDTENFYICGFRASISPLATMGARPPL
jgi:hypothetical protein